MLRDAEHVRSLAPTSHASRLAARQGGRAVSATRSASERAPAREWNPGPCRQPRRPARGISARDAMARAHGSRLSEPREPAQQSSARGDFDRDRKPCLQPRETAGPTQALWERLQPQRTKRWRQRQRALAGRRWPRRLAASHSAFASSFCRTAQAACRAIARWRLRSIARGIAAVALPGASAAAMRRPNAGGVSRRSRR